VVIVGMGDDDILNILGFETQLPDVIEDQVKTLIVTGVDDDQTVTGVDQMGAYCPDTDKIEVTEHFCGLNIIFPNIFCEHNKVLL
jgi:hypothetical protein